MANPTYDKARLPDKAGDWTYAQVQYEIGIKSIKVIAQEIGATDSAVSNRATRQGWIRDPLARKKMQEEIEAQAAEKYRKEHEAHRTEIISITATMQSTVLVEHRGDIKAARRIVTQLLEELSSVTTGIEEFDHLGDLLASPDDRGVDRLNAIYKRIISMPDRVASINALATALKTLILLERQAFGISGLIEDPEAVRAPAEVTRGLSKIMDKFNQVLALQAPTEPVVKSQPSEIIIDVSGQTEAAAT